MTQPVLDTSVRKQTRAAVVLRPVVYRAAKIRGISYRIPIGKKPSR